MLRPCQPCSAACRVRHVIDTALDSTATSYAHVRTVESHLARILTRAFDPRALIYIPARSDEKKRTPKAAILRRTCIAASHGLTAVWRLCEGEDRRQMAGSALGELVRKMGDRVVQQIVPILQVGFQGLPAT